MERSPLGLSIDVNLPQRQIKELNALAMQTGKEADELVQEAVSKMLAYEEWLRQR